MWKSFLCHIGLLFVAGFAVLSVEGSLAVEESLHDSKGILRGPLNDAQLVGTSVTLECVATSNTSWVAWVEYATGNSNGRPVSDGEDVLEGHPNSERYHIIHDTPTSYNLHVNDTVEGDGGLYKCREIEEAEEAFAELVMINGDPTCVSTIPEDGAVLGGHVYTIECTVEYRGNIAPTMTWSGAGPFAVESTTTNTTVRSRCTFTAYRFITGTFFTCKTNFTSAGSGGANYAANVPTYEHVSDGRSLNVYCPCEDTGSGYTTTLIQQSDGSDGAFNRSWDDFKTGFSASNIYWLGNDAINILTTAANCKARFDLHGEINGLWYVAEYSTFIVGDESTGYQLTVSGHSGNASDSMWYYNGMRFTTHDRDNDNHSPNNCAMLFSGAWWFDNCFETRAITLQKTDGFFGWTGVPFHTIQTKVWLVCS